MEIEVGSSVRTTYTPADVYVVVAKHDKWFALVPGNSPENWPPFWVIRRQVVLVENPKFEIGKEYIHTQSCVIVRVRCVGLCEDYVWLQSCESGGCYTVNQSRIEDYKLQ